MIIVNYMLRQRKDKLVLGVTGNIACGKSTVARLFKTKDCLLIDADVLGRRLLTKNRLLHKKIRGTFGSNVFKPSGCVDRVKLAEIVFTHKVALKKLMRIMHPPIIKEIKRLIKVTPKKIIILDAPLIIEAGLRKLVDKLIVVKAKRKQQFLRAQKNRGFGKQALAMRMKSQISQEAKLRFADFIIDNNGQISKTSKQVTEIRRKLWKS
jgi:dephospho-CoA kinase